jgi:outer membrane protein OmpA-like peptidoglycan-associated protein
LGTIAGAAVIAAAALLAMRVQRDDTPAPDDSTILLAAPAVPASDAPRAPSLVASATPRPPDMSADPAGAAADFEALSAELAEREAVVAALRATLAQRDASLDAITATLTLREAELQALRDQVAAVRERYAFDLELAALKSAGPGAAPLPPEKIETLLAAAAVPAGPAPQALTEIHFDSGSFDLSPGGQIHAAVAAAMLADMGIARVRLVGHTDRVGSPAHNRTLAEARARAVADFLVGAGVPVALIEAAGMGEDDLPVATADDVPEPLNRSVAIIAIPLPTG